MMKDDAEGTVMVDMKGVLEEADPDTAAGHLCIPSGYEGYVMIPMTAMFNGRDNSDVTGKQLTLEQLGVRINGLMIYEPEVFLIDNFFFYGTNLPEEKIGDVKVVTSSDTPTDTPSAPASENPTDEPTDASTAGSLRNRRKHSRNNAAERNALGADHWDRRCSHRRRGSYHCDRASKNKKSKAE